MITEQHYLTFSSFGHTSGNISYSGNTYQIPEYDKVSQLVPTNPKGPKPSESNYYPSSDSDDGAPFSSPSETPNVSPQKKKAPQKDASTPTQGKNTSDSEVEVVGTQPAVELDDDLVDDSESENIDQIPKVKVEHYLREENNGTDVPEILENPENTSMENTADIEEEKSEGVQGNLVGQEEQAMPTVENRKEQENHVNSTNEDEEGTTEPTGNEEDDEGNEDKFKYAHGIPANSRGYECRKCLKLKEKGAKHWCSVHKHYP